MVESLNHFIHLFDDLLQSVLVLDPDLKVVYCNDFFASQIINVPANRILRKTPKLSEVITFGEEGDRLSSLYKVAEFERYQEVFFKTDYKEGVSRVLLKPFEIEGEKYFILYLLDLTDEFDLSQKYKKANIEKQRAYVDEMTGVPNKRKFKMEFGKVLKNAEKSEFSVLLAMCDIDFFKKFNDTYGHLQGDEVLIRVAQELQKTIRETDIMCRYGGEEFTALFISVKPGDEQALLERLRESVENLKVKHVDGKEGFLSVTLSIGGCLVENLQDISNTIELDTLVSIADEQLYLSKEKGRNQANWVSLPFETKKSTVTSAMSEFSEIASKINESFNVQEFPKVLRGHGIALKSFDLLTCGQESYEKLKEEIQSEIQGFKIYKRHKRLFDVYIDEIASNGFKFCEKSDYLKVYILFYEQHIAIFSLNDKSNMSRSEFDRVLSIIEASDKTDYIKQDKSSGASIGMSMMVESSLSSFMKVKENTFFCIGFIIGNDSIDASENYFDYYNKD